MTVLRTVYTWLFCLFLAFSGPAQPLSSNSSLVQPQRIGFLVTGDEDQRKERWDGESMRHGGRGVSGSESAFVVFAEHWASQGHRTTIFASFCTERIHRGVQYTSNMTAALERVTALVILPWFRGLDVLQVPMELKFLVVNYQGVGVPDHLATFMSKYGPSIEIVSMFPSDWTRRAVHSIARKRGISLTVLSGRTFVVNNPLLMDMVEEADKNITSDRKVRWFCDSYYPYPYPINPNPNPNPNPILSVMKL